MNVPSRITYEIGVKMRGMRNAKALLGLRAIQT
jgi:hypothetical protein